MPSSNEAEYWAKRRDELLEQMAKDEQELNAKLAKLYEKEVARLERDIAAYYQKYGQDNVIEYRRLLADLSDADRRLLIERMDDFAKKYPQYAHLLPVRKSIYKLNELEGIQTSIRLQQLEIGAIEQEELTAHFERQAQRAANLAAEQMGFGSNFYSVDASVVQSTVGAAWASGAAFSERIWANRERLAAYLNDDFGKLIARGVAYDTAARELSGRFANVSTRDAKRLVYTEGTFLFNEAQARVHEGDFECYALSCVDDNRVCKVCREIQAAQKESPARFSDRQPGVNFPPLHPWCRCSYTVEVDDWDAWIDAYVAARGGDAVTKSYPSGAVGNYLKPLSEFEAKDGRRDLFAHDALGNSGRSFTALAEDAPEGYSNIDLLMNGDRWEVKSPDGANIRAVESNIRKAKDQFEKQYKPVSEGIRVVFNGRYLLVADSEITRRLALEMRRHGIDEVLQVFKDGSVKPV